MYLQIGWIAFECAGTKGSLDEARLCFTKLGKGIKVVRKSRHGSLPAHLETWHKSSKYYNDRIPMVDECLRTGAMLSEVSAKGKVTQRYFGQDVEEEEEETKAKAIEPDAGMAPKAKAIKLDAGMAPKAKAIKPEAAQLVLSCCSCSYGVSCSRLGLRRFCWKLKDSSPGLKNGRPEMDLYHFTWNDGTSQVSIINYTYKRIPTWRRRLTPDPKSCESSIINHTVVNGAFNMLFYATYHITGGFC
jgi:hypothetical protein